MPIKINSPCVRNCCLDEDEICLGCGRSLEEIMQWQGSTSKEKQKVLLRAALRKKNRHKI